MPEPGAKNRETKSPGVAGAAADDFGQHGSHGAYWELSTSHLGN